METAVNIARVLTTSGVKLDVDLVRRAALVHDFVRTRADHAAEGANILESLDEAVAAIVRVHMDHSFPDTVDEIDEADIVSLADRSVLEDRYIGYEARIRELFQRFKGDPEAEKWFELKLEETVRFARLIERRTGGDLDGMATGGKVSIEDLLRRVSRPGRYIGGEIGSVTKDAADLATRICFSFPDLYEIGMSYTGLQILYGLLNALEHVFCERAFAPDSDMEGLMRAGDVPLFTLETRTPLNRMDFVAFTLQYELSYTNVVNMIELSGIPLMSEARGEGDPFVCAGGTGAYNPEPLADLFDFYVVGDGEEIMPEICEAHRVWKVSGASRGDFLRTLSQLSGVYVPSLYVPVYDGDGNGAFMRFDKRFADLPDRIKKHVVKDLEGAYYPENPIVPVIEAVHERAVCEIARGCGRGCRFCQAGFVYRPVRRRSKTRVKDILHAQLAHTGYDEASLLSLSAGDYPEIEMLVTELMDELKPKDVALSLPSLRLNSVTDATLMKLGEYKKSSLTFAPEAGTQRLRDVIRKNITEEDILNGVEKAFVIGWHRLKLYFMIGLPTETYEDLDGIATLASSIMTRARAMQEKDRKNFTLTVSVSNFVPKPHTPFQWVRADDEETLRE
jgi:radical SAM family uncharacterized protein